VRPDFRDALAAPDFEVRLREALVWTETFRAALLIAIEQLHDERREVARLNRRLAEALTEARELRGKITRVRPSEKTNGPAMRPGRRRAETERSAKRTTPSYRCSASRASVSRGESSSTDAHHAGELEI
jgi:hypothetical protein